MDVNAQDDAGETPLHWAAMTGALPMMRATEFIMLFLDPFQRMDEAMPSCQAERGQLDFSCETVPIPCLPAGQVLLPRFQSCKIRAASGFKPNDMETHPGVVPAFTSMPPWDRMDLGHRFFPSSLASVTTKKG